MTEEQLLAIEERTSRTTPGPWYPILTDDALYMGAGYLGLDVRGSFDSESQLYVDEARDQKLLEASQIDGDRIIAITCLQAPRLADNDDCDGNAVFIATAREDIPNLIAEVRRLRQLLADNQINS